MKKILICLSLLFVFTSFSQAQKINLVGTTWILKYTIGKANSKDYQEYAKITFLKGGKADVKFSNSNEVAKWLLKGNNLVVNKTDDNANVRYLEIKISGTTGTGTAELGMTTTVSYWVRLVKIK